MKRLTFSWDVALLSLLLVAAVIFRAGYLFSNVIPFSFDHGKDSIAILHMLLTYSPKFIGPWTSIPGVFFGPAWYYLLAPGYFLTHGNPMSAVWTMVFLLVVQVALVWKKVGRLEAVMVASASAWLILSKSAWNPFPMTLIGWLLLVMLKDVYEKRVLTLRQSFFLFFITSLGFHFSAALAVFFPLTIIASLLWMKIKLTWKHALISAMGLFLPFLPQLAFEIRFHFIQTKALIAYFSAGETNPFSLGKVISVIRSFWGEAKLAFLPEFRAFQTVGTGLQWIAKTGIFFGFVLWLQNIKKTKRDWLLPVVVPALIIPLIGFFFLHFNTWYVQGMLPFVVVVICRMIRQLPKWVIAMYVVTLLITPMSEYVMYFRNDLARALDSREMLPAKLRAVQYVREKSMGKSFSSYHYVPDIYDYSYQYLYLWNAWNGLVLPQEFSYKPGETAYIPEKAELLQVFPISSAKAEKIFFIVEKPGNKDFLAAWWGQQRYGTIVGTQEISPDITVYEATPAEEKGK